MDHQDVPSISAAMSATQREQRVIQVLDTPSIVEGETTGGGVPADEQPSRKLGRRCWNAVLCVLITLSLLFTAFVAYTIALHALYDGPIDYSAALTAAAASSSPTTTTNATTIPPLFNLTVHIKDSSRLSAACVPCGTTAAVSYGGGAAVIGASAVPAFCAGEMEEREVVVPVWGMGADLTLPAALQRRDAVVDVVIRMPGRGQDYCRIAQVLTCAVRVGRGLSPCTSECGH